MAEPHTPDDADTRDLNPKVGTSNQRGLEPPTSDADTRDLNPKVGTSNQRSLEPG